jgi:exopolysaccharide biosynthesis polyprenyl glycosylphosphotransferase
MSSEAPAREEWYPPQLPTTRPRRFSQVLARHPQPRLGVAEPIRERSPVVAARHRDSLYRRGLALSDALAAVVSVLLVLPWLAGGAPREFGLAAVVVLIVLNKARGLYERDEVVLKKTTLDEVPSLVEVTGLFTLLVWLCYGVGGPVDLEPTHVAGAWAATFSLLLAGRLAVRAVARRLVPAERCLVIGEDASIAVIRSKLENARAKATVVHSLSVNECEARSASELLGLIWALAHRHDVHRVIIAPAAAGASETLDLIRAAKHAGLRVSVLPRMLEVVGSSVVFDHLDGLTLLGVRRFGLPRSSMFLKRGFDVLGSALLLLVASPFMLAIAIAIKLETRGPVLFRQTRVGRHGVQFEMLKFRSMVADADAQKEELRHLNERTGLFKLSNDPRVTGWGQLLRRTSLDELPQLVNVLRGEMSLVGPRPLVVDEDDQVHGFDRHRLSLTPGMTGPWQILGCARAAMQEMVGMDYLYVANWSLWTDVKILLRTVPHVFSSRGI